MAFASPITYADAAGARRRRVLTMLAVVALHLSLLALFLTESGSRRDRSQLPQSVQLMYMPTPTLPMRKAAASELPRRQSDTAISVALPRVDFPTLPSTESESTGQSTSDGYGAGIDWAAEARRELQAHEIRQNAPPDENHMAESSAEENWWPRAAHQKGDQYKTATGDWVVWINSNCYQVATAIQRSLGQGPATPQTYCLTQKRLPTDR